MGTRPCVAKLAHVLSRRALYGIRINRRFGLVFGYAPALSAGCACNSHSGFTSNPHSYPNATAYVDAVAYADTASNLHSCTHTFSNHHKNSYRHTFAFSNSTN